MALPSVQTRLVEFQEDVDRLLSWTSRMPSETLWNDTTK